MHSKIAPLTHLCHDPRREKQQIFSLAHFSEGTQPKAASYQTRAHPIASSLISLHDPGLAVAGIPHSFEELHLPLKIPHQYQPLFWYAAGRLLSGSSSCGPTSAITSTRGHTTRPARARGSGSGGADGGSEAGRVTGGVVRLTKATICALHHCSSCSPCITPHKQGRSP